MSYVTDQAPTATVGGPATVVDLEKEIHSNLIGMMELLKSYLGRMYGIGNLDSDPMAEPTCFIQAVSYDAHLSEELFGLLKQLCEGLGV